MKTTDIIEWLESPEGEAWSKRWHRTNYKSVLISIKDDSVHDGYMKVILWHV